VNSPESPLRAAQTRVRVERVIARLSELSDERLEGIENNLFELAELRCRCRGCGYVYRPYLERCPTCLQRA
jgi:uncharacterized OB-fold protein